METEIKRQDTRKAMLYDLRKIILNTPGLDSHTTDVIIKIMDDYIDNANQQDDIKA